MVTVKKFILVTATHLPYHDKWVKLTQDLSNALGVQYEIKEEDYVFAIEHGKTDDLGMAGLPQLFAELDDGRIVVVLWEVPLNERYEADFDKAKEVVLARIKEIVG
ncbi:MAG: hypothetical protein QW604_03520 [Fervidicoccaceae archaeon]|jgi:hypothetical protein